MPDQAHHLRKLVRASVHADATLAPGGPIIAVTSAQPTAGATTIACGLARELARLGKQVILIDANLHHPDAANHFGVDERGTIHEILNGARRAIEVLTPVNEDNLRILAGPLPACGFAPPLDREAIERFAAETAALSRLVDVVLIDAGARMNSWIDRLWQLARQVLLVATPDPQSLLDAYAAVKLSQFHRHDCKIRLLVNRTADDSEAAPLAKRFEETCRRFLFVTPKPATSLPAHSPQRQQGSEPLHRALRLLAADFIGDLRATNLSIPKPKSNDLRSVAQNFNLEDLTQRRRDAEGMQRF